MKKRGGFEVSRKMIFCKLSEANFEYDIYSLLKAFYPSEDVKVSAEDMDTVEDADGGSADDGAVDETAGKKTSGIILYDVEYTDDVLTVKGPAGERVYTIVYEHRPSTKNILKKALYELLALDTGRTLPWGTLTGIRPTKLTLGMIQGGYDDETIREHMKETYLISDEKLDLSLEVSHREAGLLSKIDLDNSYSLYIGIPFCPTRCLYCSFTAYPIGAWTSHVDEYLDALEKELAWTASEYVSKGKMLSTIYIGGGTPTSLGEEHLEKLLSMVDKYFDTRAILEYTIEAGRPDSITPEKLDIIKSHPITRISINPQTMNQKTLDLIGRHHTVDDIRRVYAMAREKGFDDINMDLITGLPGETLSDFEYTLSEIEKMAPDNLTVHSLALKHTSTLNIDKDKYDNYLIENSQTHMDAGADLAKRLGLNPYYLYRQKNITANLENIGYAREGAEGLYNILIMEEVQDIVACGCGTACKKINPDKSTSRCENVKDVGLYIEKIDEMIERKRQLFL